jgi:hypothetical protein
MAKPILLLVAFTLGAVQGPKPQPPPRKNVNYFCCVSVSDDGNSGEDCQSSSQTLVPYCKQEVLMCRSGYTMTDGKVTCTAPKK